MKTKYLYLGLLFITVSGSTCKIIAFRKYAEKMSISYGSSGGISGASTEYILRGDGDLRRYNSLEKDTTSILLVSLKQTLEIFKLADSKKIKKCVMDEAGNMTRFIRIYKNGILQNSFQWPLGKSGIPKEIKKLDDLLIQLTGPIN